MSGYRFQRWVPVAEALPDSDMTVMTYEPESSEPVWPAYHDGERWFDLMGAPINDGRITHWMVFPEPPGPAFGATDLGRLAQLCDTVIPWVLNQDLDEDKHIREAADEIMAYVDAFRP